MLPSSSSVLRAPGYVIANPSDLSDPGGDRTYGTGVLLGKTRAVALVPLGEAYRVECEGLGEFSDVLEGNNRYLVNLFLRGHDKDAFQQLMSGGYIEGATTGQPLWEEPGTQTPGQSAIARAKVLLFAPEDTIHAPALLIRRGIPDFADGAEVAFQRGEEFGLELSIECLRNAAGKILSLGMLEDITL